MSARLSAAFAKGQAWPTGAAVDSALANEPAEAIAA